MNTSDEIKNTLSFITQILSQDVLPFFEQGVHEYSVTDMSAILSKFLILQQSIVNLEGTFDEKIALIESPTIREINVLENCQTVIIPDLDILAHGGAYEIELFLGNASASLSNVKFLLNDDVLESLYESQVSTLNTGFAGSVGARAFLVDVYSNQLSYAVADISLKNSLCFYNCRGSVNSSTSFLSRISSGWRNQQILNITSLTIYSDVSNGIAAGSKIIIRRKDV